MVEEGRARAGEERKRWFAKEKGEETRRRARPPAVQMEEGPPKKERERGERERERRKKRRSETKRP